MSRIAALAVWMILAFPAVALSAGPEIFLQEEPETYLIIDKLEGLGILPALMTGDRGLEAREVSRQADAAEGTGDPVVNGMVRFLRLGYEADFDFRLRAGLEGSRDGRVPPNAQGLPVLEDGGIRTGGFFRWRPAEWIGLQARGDFLVDANGDRIGRLEETSIRLGWPQATLEFGRLSLWWGPGRHGALLFTTNAQTLPGIRVRNPHPILFGSWFRFLGLFQYDFFLARLNADRPIPDPILSGLRLAIKPTPWLELGASRALQFGGEGGDESLSAFFDIFRGKSESPGNTPEGNSLASIDAKIRLPFRRQPVILYVEGGGEDQSGSGVPSRWAWMGGVFLPSIGATRKADLRIEFADNIDFSDQSQHPGVWYQHSQYPHRYRGQILGHHMGTDARDLFIEVHYFLLPSSFIEANIDLTQRDFPGPEREETWRVSGAVVAWLTPFLRGEGRLAYEEVSDEGGTFGNDSRDMTIQVGISYHYR
jgi:hypothetical protein